jgi:hypothetical protein
MGATLSSENSLGVYNPALELVKSLSTQTERGQLFWDPDCSIISTRLRDATSIEFRVHPSVSGSKDWSLFTVHSAGGQRLLDAPNPRKTRFRPFDLEPGLFAFHDERA